jgi:hypothetical protein
LLLQCPKGSAQWLSQALESIESAADPLADHQIASAMARRKLGDGPFKVTLQSEREGVTETGHWLCSDAGRILLAMALFRATDRAPTSLLSEVYAYGDERERAALLKGLSLLDGEGQWSIEAEDCCRTNSLVLLTAIGMKNPYPARHFSSRGFNQLVLKSLFMGLNIAHLQDLKGRRNSELSEMCAGYIGERVAAGRDYPASIWLAIRLSDCGSDAQPHLAASILSEDPSHRYYAAASLLQEESIPAAIGDKIREQYSIETDDRIKGVFKKLTDSGKV